MFHHIHPYPPYILPDTKRLIVGTLTPPRFTTGELNAQDVDFCYGSSNGMLWKIWDRLYDSNLVYENTHFAIEQRKAFLKREKIGICDIVGAAYRDKIDASDLGMQQPELRDLFEILEQHPKVDTLIFTGGSSKNGPEYFLRKLLKKAAIPLECIDDQVPRKHQFVCAGRVITTHSLTAPSGTANRAIGSMAAYKEAKAQDPRYTTFDFRVEQYGRVFRGGA
ncbi:uracil-DNA glycosylase family protein [Flavobacteriaceae bacterium]|nr:uracil-DNA glycosylase family protein [Flavobacteriaceae bacterium]MDA9985014.1 uracil-DNA glycosylase family protein [Flavobacteriaceae bacterium]MDB4118433.1 uracil-DNA glycosylase family protein [Flavobacteriaceae bacterium]